MLKRIRIIPVLAMILLLSACGKNFPDVSDEVTENVISAYTDEKTSVNEDEEKSMEPAAEDLSSETDENRDPDMEKGEKASDEIMPDDNGRDVSNTGSDMPEEISGIEEIITDSEPESLLLGDQRFDEYIPLLTDKRVALFSNHTGLVISSDEQMHILDALIERGVDVTAVFSPEHGFRGDEDAGASVSSSVDEKTGVPVLSLYSGGSNYPSDADMDRFDVLVVDIQDVGLRYYTYHISMFYLMEACSGHGKKVIVLDRPNPNCSYVDGPVLKDAFRSGVGRLPIPVVHGMTLGELAEMINGEGWLKSGKDSCDLTVIPCKNYTRDTEYELPVNPSPNLKSMRAIYLYASTCFFENSVVSVGRGTDRPFEIYGSPYLEGAEGYDFSFMPKSMSGAKDPPYEGQVCYGR